MTATDLTDPIVALGRDRANARQQGDGNANLCVVSSVDADGEPQARVLVLRDIESRLAIFFNGSSPKASEFDHSYCISVLSWLPSLGVQYRMACRLEAIDPQVVRESWQLRPLAAKRLDWLYQRSPQGSTVEDRETLLARLEQMESDTAPANALGFFLDPMRIDRLALDNETGVHDRHLFEREGNEWRCQTLIP